MQRSCVLRVPAFIAARCRKFAPKRASPPGALYVYFASKEDLIAGLAERDRGEFQERLAPLNDAADVLQALRVMGEQYFVEEPVHKRLMCIELGVESTRNEKVGEIYRSVDRFVHDSFRALFERMNDEGRIAPDLDIATLAGLFAIIGDGMMWRRAIDPDFKPEKLLPAVTALVGSLLNPVTPIEIATLQDTDVNTPKPRIHETSQ